ncbi:MAG TPA: glycosyltransferase [Actinomycetota bacterium]
MKVSLIATVKDAGEHIREFIDSVRAQTRPPDEVVIVDGGSTDGTLEALREAPEFTVISEPGANIARGRNLAIRSASHDVIAVTDADCVLAPDWLEHLLEPMERGAAISAGFYRPIATSLLQRCAAAAALPEDDELRPGWMPSARSIAFRRDAFDAAGGYPEWLEVGEDMYLNHRLQAGGTRMDLAPDAVTYWRVRPTLAATWRQYARYARGDALAGMYPERHAIRFVTYGFALVALRSRRPALLGLAAAGAAAYAARPFRRARRRWSAGRPGDAAAEAVGVPAMMAFIDAAKMWGYVDGLVARYLGRID